MIEISNLNVLFNKNTPREIHAVQNISFQLINGSFLVLVGSNGSGKTTLLNSIAGSVAIDSGKITIDSINISSQPDYDRSKFISRIFQNPLLGTSPDLSIIENFRLAKLRSKRKSLTLGITEEFKEEVIFRIRTLGMGLENKIYQPMASLSGGQRQALTLLMSVMDDCKLLLMDEPTAALDPKSSVFVMEKAQEIISANNLTAIYITHQMKDAIKYGNRIIQMREGRIVKDLNEKEKARLSLNEIVEWF